MKCDEIRKKLSAYCDGELKSHEMKTVEQHVSECADCAKSLFETRRIFDGLQKMREVKAPTNLAGDVQRKIKALPGKKSGLKKIFHPLPFKIPLELAATFLIGIFIYRVILPHHPIGKGPNLEVKVDPSLRDKADTFPEHQKSTAEKVATDLRPRLLPLVKESSRMETKKSDTDVSLKDIEQKQTGLGRLEEKKISASEENQILERKRAEIQKDFSRKEKKEPGVFDEGRMLPPAGESSAKHQPELFPAAPKMSPPMTAQVAKSIEAVFRADSMDEEHAQEKPVVPVIVETQEGNTDVQSAGFAAAGKGESEADKALPQRLESSFVQQNVLKEEKPQEISTNLGRESEGISEHLSARTSAQPLAPDSEKAKIQREMRDQKSSEHYVWRYNSEEIQKEMFLFVQEKGWKAESRAVRTFQISLPHEQKDDFLDWLNTHGKLMDIEDTAKPENSETSQTLILDLEFEDAP